MDPLLEYARGVHFSVREQIEATRDIGQLKAITSRLHSELDKHFAEGMVKMRGAISCREGCAYCCYYKVDVTPAEAFLIADFIRTRFSPGDLRAVVENAEANKQKLAPMKAKLHMSANLACPLLRNGRCSAYEVRPALCRIHHAREVGGCVAAFERPDRLDIPNTFVPGIREMTCAVNQAFTDAYATEGYDAQPYDLNSALLAALGDGAAEKKWASKKAPFPAAALAKDYAELHRTERLKRR
jgi:Fe-S-cluster containining protein